MNTTIRAARVGDAGAIADIYNQGLAERGATWLDVVIVERLIPENLAEAGTPLGSTAISAREE